MAEKVRVNLERQLAELRDLRERQLFTDDEISSIVARRTALESAVHAKTCRPQDFLDYVNYESSLDSLRAIRAKKQRKAAAAAYKGQQQSGAAKKPPKKYTLSDWSMSKRQTKLLDMACRRFPREEVLWDRQLSHLRSIKPFPESDVSKTLMSAVAAMPLNAKYWIQAAQFQDRSGDSNAARKMFMRGTRVCNDLKLWLAWMLFEVDVAERLRQRWTLLGLLPSDGDRKEQQQPGDAPDVLSLDVDGDEEADALPSLPQEDNAVLDGQIIRLVVDHLLQKYPTAHLDIAASLRSKPVNLTPDLLQYIHQSLPANAVSSAHWPWQALAASASDLDKLEAINQVVEALKSQKKWQAILDFAGARLAEEQVMPETVAYLEAQVQKAKRKLAKSTVAALR